MSTATLDQERLDAFMGRVVGELGATFNAVLVGLGDRLGLYAAMRDGEPVTPEELARPHGHVRAARAGVAERARRPAASSRTTPRTAPTGWSPSRRSRCSSSTSPARSG